MPTPSFPSDASRPDTPADAIDVREHVLTRQQESALREMEYILRLAMIQLRRAVGLPMTEEDAAVVMAYFSHAHVTASTLQVIKAFPEQWDAWLAQDLRDIPGATS